MGNEQSYMTGLQIDQKAVETTDFFSHYSACLSSAHPSELSVFIGERLVSGSLWLSQTPLEKISKNLMIYRHPCILKYVSSWKKGSEFLLAVENAKPLSHVLPRLNGLQICIGLHSILKALCFLHETAQASHNNICVSSIYVTKDGSWKLGGMEYLCTFKELSSDYILKTQNSRYEKAIDPDETKNLQKEGCRKDFIDIYGFSVLAIELLKTVSDDEISSVSSFCNICKSDLQNINVNLRPKLVDLLFNPFFNHDFIKIYSFLTELPLKTDEEKTEFFSLLPEKLRLFNEVAVASQLAALLLSRLVLLNKTAQKTLLPLILCPGGNDEDHVQRIFSQEVFKQYVIPKLLEIFRVRDAEVRRLLLNFFAQYFLCFSKEELQSEVLPELLVGIKDTNDELVALTLRALADLVPLLGSVTVIGGKRAKLFTDGRPVVHAVKHYKQRNIQLNTKPSISRVSDSVPEPSTVNLTHSLVLPERPQPDGEEVDTLADEVEQSAEDDLETWEDWDANNDNSSMNISDPGFSTSPSNTLSESTFASSLSAAEPDLVQGSSYETLRNKSLPDITELDIKNQRNSLRDVEDVDFFQDMEPVIECKPRLFLFADSESAESVHETEGVSKLSLKAIDLEETIGDGWGEEDWD